jgi:hypothetical protein
MLRTVIRRAVALALLFALAPFASELVEWGAHYLQHGDYVHANGHDPGPADEEHGCTTLFHLCGCHATFATGPARARLDPMSDSRRPSFVALRPSHGRDQDPPPHLPPLA